MVGENVGDVDADAIARLRVARRTRAAVEVLVVGNAGGVAAEVHAERLGPDGGAVQVVHAGVREREAGLAAGSLRLGRSSLMETRRTQFWAARGEYECRARARGKGEGAVAVRGVGDEPRRDDTLNARGESAVWMMTSAGETTTTTAAAVGWMEG